jgi:hypothetical protein
MLNLKADAIGVSRVYRSHVKDRFNHKNGYGKIKPFLLEQGVTIYYLD